MPIPPKSSPYTAVILFGYWIFAGCSQTQSHTKIIERKVPLRRLAEKEVDSTLAGIDQNLHKVSVEHQAWYSSGGGGGSSSSVSIKRDRKFFISCRTLNEMQIASLIESCEAMVEAQISQKQYTNGCYKYQVEETQEKDGSPLVLIEMNVNWSKVDH